MLKDQVSKLSQYRVSRYFDYIDLGFGSQFNYYFPQMFLQRGLLPKNIIRDSTSLENVLVLNLFPDSSNGKGIFHLFDMSLEIPDAIKEKYNIHDSKIRPEGANLKDKIKSTIDSFQTNLLQSKSKLTNLSFVKIKEKKQKKRKKIKRLKKLIKTEEFKRELRELRELIKLSKNPKIRSKRRKYSHTKEVKKKMKIRKHHVVPILLKQKLISKNKKLKQLSLNSSVFFEKKDEKEPTKNQKMLSNADDENSISVSQYLVDKNLKGRSRINQFNWALIGFSKLKYK